MSNFLHADADAVDDDGQGYDNISTFSSKLFWMEIAILRGVKTNLTYITLYRLK